MSLQDDLYMSKEEAEQILQTEMKKADIPLSSKTARCMFERTEDSYGQNRCKFGTTPLWGNEVRVVKGRVLRSEFMEKVRDLCDSGRRHQDAGRASRR